MRKQEIDYILGRMLDSHENVSDVNVTVGKSFQVEASGQLIGVELEPPFMALTPFQTEIFALNLINQDRRLTEALLGQGSCDSSYDLPGKTRFRVSIFSQRGNYSIVLRKLENRIPTCHGGKVISGGGFGAAHRRGTGAAFPGAYPFSDGDLRAQPDQSRPAADGGPPGPGVVRFLV